jgi:hypothetical protein
MTELNIYKPILTRNYTISIPVSKPFQGLSLQLPTEEKNIIYPDNYNDIQTLLELSDFSDSNVILHIGLREFHPGWEEEDCYDRYYLYQKIRKCDLTRENFKKLEQMNKYNNQIKCRFDLTIFNESFLDTYKIISCVKEQYDNCQYKLYKVHYSS